MYTHVLKNSTVVKYEFLRKNIFKKSNKLIIDLDSIISQIYTFNKQHNSLNFMFEDIEFRTNIDNVISSDISEGINNLQTFGIVGKLNPKYEKLVIYLTPSEAEEILSECDDKVEQAMTELAYSFR